MSVRVALAGYGLAGEFFHAPLIEAAEGLELAGVATRSRGNLQEVLASADVLVVATPNRSHVELATAGLERGLHVVVDKPLAPTAEEARQLIH